MLNDLGRWADFDLGLSSIDSVPRSARTSLRLAKMSKEEGRDHRLRSHKRSHGFLDWKPGTNAWHSPKPRFRSHFGKRNLNSKLRR